MGATGTVTPQRGAATKSGGGAKIRRKRERISFRQVLHLLHRLGILVAAVAYFVVCMKATVSTLDLTHDLDRSHVGVADQSDKQHILGSLLGATTIRESPLVALALQGDTSPRNTGTLYLEPQGASWTICTGITYANRDIYTDTFLRSVYDDTVASTAYNLTFLAELELITPVVDCMSLAILLGYQPTAKFNFLVRNKKSASTLGTNNNNDEEVGIVTLQLSNQEYRIFEQSECGAAGIATLTYISDLRARDVLHHYLVSVGYPFVALDFRVATFRGVTSDNMWALEEVPNVALGDIPKNIVTAFRSGFYIKSETEQFNINNQVNILAPHDPIATITEWNVHTKTVMHDSWGWVHFVQLFLALDLLLSLAVLLIVTFRNFQAGKLWLGDAFVAISSRALSRGVLILVSWYANGFWNLFEFCVGDAYATLDLGLETYSSIITADLLGVYLSFCGLAGMIFRENVDPIFATLAFVGSFELRRKLLHALPQTAAAVSAYGYATFIDSVPPYQLGQENISPMGFWTSHELHGMTPLLVVRVLSPILLSLVLIVAYILACKIRRFFVPDKTRVLRNTTDNTGTAKSGGEEMVLTQKRVLTLFEIATGAELESRFGVLSSFEKHLFIKGMKFASADGIYSNGFVIANGKFLLQLRDYWTIVAMKLTRWRFKSVFVYEITGSTVQQTAKLVYPTTLSWKDMLNLNISVLS